MRIARAPSIRNQVIKKVIDDKCTKYEPKPMPTMGLTFASPNRFTSLKFSKIPDDPPRAVCSTDPISNKEPMSVIGETENINIHIDVVRLP